MELPAYSPDSVTTGSAAHEHRRHHDLVSQHEEIDDQVMAVQLPTQGSVGDGKPISVKKYFALRSEAHHYRSHPVFGPSS